MESCLCYQDFYYAFMRGGRENRKIDNNKKKQFAAKRIKCFESCQFCVCVCDVKRRRQRMWTEINIFGLTVYMAFLLTSSDFLFETCSKKGPESKKHRILPLMLYWNVSPCTRSVITAVVNPFSSQTVFV